MPYTVILQLCLGKRIVSLSGLGDNTYAITTMRYFLHASDVIMKSKASNLTIAFIVSILVYYSTNTVIAYSADSNFKVLDLVVDQSGFVKICEVLQLSEEQKEDASQFFEVYSSAITSLDADAKQRADEAGFARARELGEEARNAGLEPPRDEIAELMNQARGEYHKAYKKSDVLLLKFYEQLQTILLQTQEQLFERIPRLVRRLNWQRRKANSVKNDFMSIDLFPLVEEARAEDGELEAIFTTNEDKEQELKLEEFRNEIMAALLRYELEFDTIILEGHAKRRRKRISATNAEDREADWKRTAQKFSKQWSRYYSFTDRAVVEIADIAERALNAQAKEAWIERYDAKFCPDLYAERWPERMIDWLLGRPDFTAEQLELTEIQLVEYLSERQRLRRAAIAIGVRAMQKHLSWSGTEPLQLKHAQRLLDLSDLSERTITRFRSQLTAEQRVALTNEIKGVKSYRPYILGPHVDRIARHKLTGELRPMGVLLLVNPKTGQRIPNRDDQEEEDDEQEQDDGG